MTAGNHETFRRVETRFNRTLEEENLTLEGPLTATELNDQYRDRLVELRRKAFNFLDEDPAEWIDRCIQEMTLRALLLTNEQDRLVGFTWGVPFEADDLTVDGGEDFVSQKRGEHGVASHDMLYSSALAIDPEYQGKGLGSGLALAALQRCQELYPDGSLLFYRTLPENAAARHISESFGAQRIDLIDPRSRKFMWYGHVPSIGSE